MRISIALAVLFLAGHTLAGSAAHLFQKPTLNRTHIVFSCAGHLWSVPREGGEARRLTSGPGVETNAVFSPDGRTLAFTGQYDGNVDVFVMPAEGGEPKRLTWHPAADLALGWTPDGRKVLFASSRTSASRYSQLFCIGLEGGLPEPLPLPMGAEGAFSADGTRIAYVPLSKVFATWKRYRGGTATPVWIADLATSRVLKVPRETSNDFNPMWIGDRVYFLSDRKGPVSLWAYDTRTRKVEQALANAGLDLKSASAGPDAIVFEQFGALGLFDLKSSTSRLLPVTLAGDFQEVRERILKVGDQIRAAHLSPSGARAVFEAHGEILTVPAEKGDPRNLTATPAVMERSPAWSPDGKSIAYFSDASGEYALHVKAQNGKGEAAVYPLGNPASFYFTPVWSPDSRKIAFTDAHQALWVLDLDSRKPVKIDKDRFWSGRAEIFHPGWSPDSRWLAYAKRLPNYMGAVFLHDLVAATSTQVTDGMSDARHPVFDRGGKFLWFTASTDSGASLQPDIHAFSRPTTRSVYLAVLAKDEVSPFAPESDEEKGDTKPKTAEGEGKAPAAPAGAGKPEEKPKATRIDLPGILQRVLAVPMPARPYLGLQAGKAGTLVALEAGSPFAASGGSSLTVHRFDLKARKADVLATGVGTYLVAAAGEKALQSQAGRWSITTIRPVPAGTAPPPPAPPTPAASLATERMEVRVDPRAEWSQMFREAWKIQREYFYDKGYHGLDLAAAERKYQAFLPALASRADLNYLMQEMLGEVTVSHLGVGGGNLPSAPSVGVGLLGADFAVANGHYQFKRIYNGENWNPQLRAPLTQPGVNVLEGEYLLAVDGREATPARSPYAYFEGSVGRSVTLRVGPRPGLEGSREVAVQPVASEQGLRNLAWIEDNRRHVEKQSGGRVGYVYMPDTAGGGYTFFNRYFYPQVGKQALIVDERFNGGGNLATDIAELLKRPLMSMVATRDGEDEVQPQGAVFGPKVMLINEYAGSGGDAMPYYFRKAGVGKLIGKRTWGGLVGRSAGVPLMDGGFVGSPTSAVWDPHSRQWIAENVGVEPDFEVEWDPELLRKGSDPQLDKAIAVVLSELDRQPPLQPARPAYPVYPR